MLWNVCTPKYTLAQYINKQMQKKLVLVSWPQRLDSFAELVLWKGFWGGNETKDSVYKISSKNSQDAFSSCHN